MGIRVKRAGSKVTEEDAGAVEKVAKPDLVPTYPESIEVSEPGDGLITDAMNGLRKTAELGGEAVGLGVVKLTNGHLLGAKNVVLNVMEKMQDRIRTAPDESVASARTIASLGNSMAKLSTQFRAANESGPKKPKTRKNSFALGQAVQVNVQVNNDTKPKDP